MRDGEIVASIVAGDPEGLATAYDKYAAVLYGYCKTFLREPADAADAVQDTFLTAAGSLGRLRDPERLRPWLYAMARNRCLRKLRAEKAAAAGFAVPALAGQDAGQDSGADGGGERAELRALLRAAGGGLNPGERDVIELSLWQGLDAAEAAAVLGITRGHVQSVLSRGRDQLTASIGALLVACTGREECDTLGRMLRGWDRRLTVPLRKRLSRHIERCDSCCDRQRSELGPALLSIWPAAALADAALADQAMHAAALPAELKTRVLKAAADGNATTAARGARLGGSRGFRENGFPKPAANRALGSRGARARQGLAGVAGRALPMGAWFRW